MLELLACFLLIEAKQRKTGTKVTVSEGYTMAPEYSLIPELKR